MTRISQNQKSKLIDLVQQHYEELFGFCVPNGNQRRSQIWAEISTELNSGSTTHRVAEQWKRTWWDIKKAVKNKINLIRANRNITGGGEPDQFIFFTEDEEKIIEMCSIESFDGVANVEEVGLGRAIQERMNEASDSTPTPAIEGSNNTTPTTPEFSPITPTIPEIIIPQFEAVSLSRSTEPPNEEQPSSPSTSPLNSRNLSESARRSRARRDRISEILPPIAQRRRNGDGRNDSFGATSGQRSLRMQEESLALLTDIRKLLTDLNSHLTRR